MFNSGGFREKLPKILFQLLIFLLPTQLAYHFWPKWAFVRGVRVDYLSPTIYLTDCVVFLLLLFFIIEIVEKRKAINIRGSRKSFFKVLGIVSLLIFSIINCLYAEEPAASLFKWIKVYELIFLAIYISYKKKLLDKKLTFTPLFLAVVYSSLIAAVQFFNQATIGGPLYFLGERSFSASTPGIAKALYLGRELMRPYSVFPHPNALAGFILVSCLFLVTFKKRILIKVLLITIALIVLLLSASFAAWISLLIISLFYLVSQKAPSFFKGVVLSFYFLSLVASLLSPLLSGYLGKLEKNFSQSVLERAFLNEAGGKMVTKAPFAGIGLNNFVVLLPKTHVERGLSWFLQPVHNIFLLAFIETGVIGLLLFTFVFWQALIRAFQDFKEKKVFIFVLLAVIITGSFDHYWFTLQQNQLLLALFLGLIYR